MVEKKPRRLISQRPRSGRFFAQCWTAKSTALTIEKKLRKLTSLSLQGQPTGNPRLPYQAQPSMGPLRYLWHKVDWRTSRLFVTIGPRTEPFRQARVCASTTRTNAFPAMSASQLCWMIGLPVGKRLSGCSAGHYAVVRRKGIDGWHARTIVQAQLLSPFHQPHRRSKTREKVERASHLCRIGDMARNRLDVPVRKKR